MQMGAGRSISTPRSAAGAGIPEADGPSGLSAGFHNGQNTPIEMIEAIFPLRFERYAFLPNSGGAGRMRGGLGLVREWRFIAEHGLLNASFDAFVSRPYGLQGGEPGRGGRLSVIRDGEVTAFEGQDHRLSASLRRHRPHGDAGRRRLWRSGDARSRRHRRPTGPTGTFLERRLALT